MPDTDKNRTLHQKTASWTALQYFNIYRILLAGLFVSLIHIGQLPQPLGVLDVRMFSIVSHGYLFVAIVFILFTHYRFPRLNLQIASHVLLDIIMLSLMMYSSNGLSSGFGMLLVIAVAGGSILCAGKIAILFAAIATLAVLGHELYFQFFLYSESVNYIHAGILGATFFVAAIIGNLLSARVKETEALAEQQAIEINELAKLNEHIVQRMQSGVIVLDRDRNILLINESARHLLHRSGIAEGVEQDSIINLLKDDLTLWLEENTRQQNFIIRPDGQEQELQVSFLKLRLGNTYQVLVFVEDIVQLRQRAQQLKLASLGRLTASIAHEVRNPLGAINHASQLLQESSDLSPEDKRLTEIISEHSGRVNNIIENVMSVSRREKAILQKISLKPLLKDFIAELTTRFDLSTDMVVVDFEDKDMEIKMDPSQLRQILWNLCENALRYSTGKPLLKLHCGIDKETQRAYIDIIDTGTGITDDARESLFEPFFTTESSGSGLGLFLARELSEANQATLSLLQSSEKGSVFRLTFMHNRKEELLV